MRYCWTAEATAVRTESKVSRSFVFFLKSKRRFFFYKTINFEKQQYNNYRVFRKKIPYELLIKPEQNRTRLKTIFSPEANFSAGNHEYVKEINCRKF